MTFVRHVIKVDYVVGYFPSPSVGLASISAPKMAAFRLSYHISLDLEIALSRARAMTTRTHVNNHRNRF